MEQGERVQTLQKGGIVVKEKKDITQEPEYQELKKLLAGMSEDRREALATMLEKEIEKGFMTTAEAAEKLQINKATVRLWLTNGRLKGRRFGGRWRVSIEDVNRLLADDAGEES